jgi:hypothetical protein
MLPQSSQISPPSSNSQLRRWILSFVLVTFDVDEGIQN